jgi:UrcA family protein
LSRAPAGNCHIARVRTYDYNRAAQTGFWQGRITEIRYRTPLKKKEFGMKTRHQLLLAAIIGPAALASPALAQDAAPKWKPTLEQVIISAKAPRNYRVVLSNSRLGEAFLVSASMEVPYNDLNLAKDPDADELGRRIHVAARLICEQKYPQTQYPILEGFDCEHDAAKDGMERANLVIASARH